MSTWVITGANRGIGLELSKQLVRRSQVVIAGVRDPKSADELAALDVPTYALDVTSASSTRAFADQLEGRPVDVLINNAGRGGAGPGIEELDFDIVENYFEVNAIGPMRMAQALLPNLRAGQRKIIAQISSRLGSITENTEGGTYAYRASKAALNMFTRSLAHELEAEGFCCAVLHPGWVQTEMGGTRAPISVEESCAGLLRVIDSLTISDNGQFLTFTGDNLPW